MPANQEKIPGPEIELYLYSLNQEFPVSKGHASFLKTNSEFYPDKTGKIAAVKQVAGQVFRTAADDWSVQWVSNEWVENYTYYPGGALVEQGDPLLSAIMRQEDFGGIIFDRLNDRIYKVNQPGFELFRDIQKAHAEGQLGSFRHERFATEDVRTFMAFLKGAGVWPAV
jgi:hypothetical protein